MSGITGFISNKVTKKDEVLDGMMQRIKHRGPDGSGTYINDDIALGYMHLSILDTKTGQPIFNHDKTLSIIFNGKIYNYLELKEDLEKKGYKFKTKTDTEVILYAYEEYKEKVVNHLRGMFAFVIYNIETKKVFGARDHFGVKPFYYYHQNEEFLFASEIKSFLDYPNFKKELNLDVLHSYLSFGYVPTNETFFKNVFKLEAGHYFTLKDNNFKTKKYFNLKFDEQEGTTEDFVQPIAEIMEDSVKKHMISDVEVGSFLSSGIDSSYLVALGKPNKTFTAGYNIPKYNEIKLATDLTNRLGLTNKSIEINKEEYLSNIPKIMYHLDDPIADPAAISLYFVSKLASENVKVVLSGEGADELFGGYNYYRKDVDVSIYNKIPFSIRRIIANIASLLPEVRGINFLIRRGRTLEEEYIGVNKVFSEKERNKIVKKKIKNIKNKVITKNVYKEQKNQSDIIKMQAVDINFWLANDIFQKADKMTMAHSIEGRSPFADVEVFNIAKTLPENAKVTKENTKLALRLAAKKVIPNESYNKKKLGFPVPLREWMKTEEFYNDIKIKFNSDIANEIFNTKKIMKLLDDHINNKKDNYKKIWTIYVFIVWYQEYFK